MTSCLAHPRVGGEYGHDLLAMTGGEGSSPRGRGIPELIFCTVLIIRLIPAWAGNTRGTVRPAETPWAHPRVGGEYCLFLLFAVPSFGSSPRGRGIQGGHEASRCGGGLIPAWAGNTETWRRPSLRARAHPRVGGEYRS